MKSAIIRATVLTLFLLQLTAVVQSFLLKCPNNQEENCGCTVDPYFMRTCTQNHETIEMISDLSNVSSSFEFLCSNVNQGEVFDSLKIDSIGVISSEASVVTINACPSSVVSKILSSIQEQTNSPSLTLIVNNLTTLSHDTFSFNVQLKTLTIRGNQLKELHENIFQSQPDLKELNLSGNQIEDLNPNLLYGVSLVKLDLTYNKLMNLHMDIVSIESLQKIALNGNLFKCNCDFLTKYYDYEDIFDQNDICDGMSFDQKLLSLTCMDNEPTAHLGASTSTTPRTTSMPPDTSTTTDKSSTSSTTTQSSSSSTVPTKSTKPTETTPTPKPSPTPTPKPSPTTSPKPTPTTTPKPSPTPSPKPKPTPKPSTGMICLIVFIVLLICLIIALLAYYCIRKPENPRRYEQLN